MFVAWGDELGLLYNEAYAPILADKHPSALGRSLRDVWAEVWPEVGPLVDAALAGEAVYREDLPLVVHRSGRDEQAWFTFSYSPVRDEGSRVAGLFCVISETTDKVLADRRIACLVELGDRTRHLRDARAAMNAAAEVLGRQLGCARAGYGEVGADGDRITVEGGWQAQGVFPVAERHSLVEYGEAFLREYCAGRTVVVVDFDRDPRATAGSAAAHAALGVRAQVVVPLVKAGRLAALLFVHSSVPRRWTDADRALAEEVAERTWAAVERARAVTALQASDARLRELNATLEGQVEARTDEHNLLAKIVETTDVMIMVSDLDYNILALNQAVAVEFERVYGVRPKVGDNMLGLLADQPEHQAQVREGWRRGLAGEELTVVEEYGDPGRGRPNYEIKFRVLRDDQGQRVGCYQFVTDVSERLREQARLSEAEAALRQSQKMEAVGQLTGGLAHDFNNLLAGISGSLELLQSRLAQGRIKDVDRYVTAAQGAAKRAAALTHRLLAFTRRQTLDPRPTDVNRLVAGMEELVRRTVGPAVDVEIVGAGRLWATLVDPNQLENALLNLCINARDAMPDGGRLTVGTDNTWLDVPAARECDLPPGQYVSLCVSDTGTGMTPEVAARAFDPFFTTKPIGMGTGLGLSMIYGFVQQSGGQARIHSEPGQGTTICLYLPRFHGEAADGDAEPELGETPRAKAAETVLVVDDEPTVRMLVAEVLGDLGYTAIEASDDPSGVEVLRSDARIDLLISDVGLPGGLNGRQVADAGRAVRPGLRVLFITGYAENAVLGNGHLDPGMHVMTKPFAMEALAGRIKELIAGSQESAAG